MRPDPLAKYSSLNAICFIAWAFAPAFFKNSRNMCYFQQKKGYPVLPVEECLTTESCILVELCVGSVLFGRDVNVPFQYQRSLLNILYLCAVLGQ